MVQLLRVSLSLLFGASAVLAQSQDFLGFSTRGRRMETREVEEKPKEFGARAKREPVAMGPSDAKDSNSTAVVVVPDGGDAAAAAAAEGGGGLISMEQGCSVGSMFVIVLLCIGGICYQIKTSSGDPRQLAPTSVVPASSADAIVLGHAPKNKAGSPAQQLSAQAVLDFPAPLPAPAQIEVVVGKPIRVGFASNFDSALETGFAMPTVIVPRSAVAQGVPQTGVQVEDLEVSDEEPEDYVAMPA